MFFFGSNMMERNAKGICNAINCLMAGVIGFTGENPADGTFRDSATLGNFVGSDFLLCLNLFNSLDQLGHMVFSSVYFTDCIRDR